MANSYSVEAILRATGADKFAQAFDNAKQSVDKFKEAGKKMEATGKNLTKKVTVPLMALGGVMIKLGSDYDDQMSTVQAVTGATADEMANLSDLAREMGKNTRYSASEAATAQENLARAGFTTDEIMDSLASTLNLATSGALSLDEASGIAARTIRGFGLEASDAERVADVLAYTAAATNTTVGGLGETFKYVAPTAAGLGIGLEEVAAAAGLMGDAGIDAGQAGNMLRRGLLNLASPTAQQADLLSDLGLEMFDAEGNMKPLVDVVGELEKGLDGMTAQQKTAALSTLFGAQAVSGWTAVVNEGSDSLNELTGEIMESSGYAQEFADIAEDNLAGSFRSMRSSAEEAMLSIYEMGSGPIRDLVDWITRLIDRFSGMDEGMRQWVVILGVVAAAVGPVIWLVGKLVAGIGFLLSPIGLVIAAIVALVAGFVYFWNTSESFRTAIIAIWENIRDKLIQAWETVRGYLETAVTAIVGFIQRWFTTLKQWWTTNQESVLETVSRVWNTIKEVFNTIISTVVEIVRSVFGGLVSWWQENQQMILETATLAWETLKQYISIAIQAVTDFIRNVFGGLVIWWQENNEMILQAARNVWNVIKTVITVVMGAILAIMQKVWPLVLAVVKFAWDGIKNVIEGAIKVITGIITFFSALFTGNWSGMWESIKGIALGAVQALWGFIQLWIVGKIIGLVKTFIAAAKTLFSGMWTFVKNLFTNSLTFIFNKVMSIFTGITNFISSVMGAIKNVVTGGLNLVKSVFRNIFMSLKGIVTGAFNAVRTAISGGMSKALSTVTNFLGKFTSAGKNIVTSIAKGITGAVGKVTDAIGGVVSKVRDFLPFSPAKEGPLEDLNKLNFGGTIADSIYGGQSTIEKAMSDVLASPLTVGNFQTSHSVTHSMANQTSRTDSLLERLANKESVIILDSGELVGATYPQYDRVGGSQTQLTERWGR